MARYLTNLWLQQAVREPIRFIPTPYQQGIEHCFDQSNARLWFPKTERQIGLTTILAACVAKHFSGKEDVGCLSESR